MLMQTECFPPAHPHRFSCIFLSWVWGDLRVVPCGALSAPSSAWGQSAGVLSCHWAGAWDPNVLSTNNILVLNYLELQIEPSDFLKGLLASCGV